MFAATHKGVYCPCSNCIEDMPMQDCWDRSFLLFVLSAPLQSVRIACNLMGMMIAAASYATPLHGLRPAGIDGVHFRRTLFTPTGTPIVLGRRFMELLKRLFALAACAYQNLRRDKVFSFFFQSMVLSSAVHFIARLTSRLETRNVASITRENFARNSENLFAITAPLLSALRFGTGSSLFFQTPILSHVVDRLTGLASGFKTAKLVTVLNKVLTRSRKRMQTFTTLFLGNVLRYSVHTNETNPFVRHARGCVQHRSGKTFSPLYHKLSSPSTIGQEGVLCQN